MSTFNKQSPHPSCSIQDAFTIYVQENQESFYRLAYSYVKDSHSALDMIQTAIYQALKSIHTLKEPSYMKTWFYRILVNTCLDELRRNQYAIATDPAELPELLSTDPETEAQPANLDLYHALEHLNPTAKTIITLRYFEDMTLNQIADILGENISTVKTKLYRGLAKLRIELKEEEEVCCHE